MAGLMTPSSFDTITRRGPVSAVVQRAGSASVVAVVAVAAALVSVESETRDSIVDICGDVPSSPPSLQAATPETARTATRPDAMARAERFTICTLP